jgi:hypothetical protein
VSHWCPAPLFFLKLLLLQDPIFHFQKSDISSLLL